MNNYLENKIEIQSQDVDYNLKLSIPGLMSIFQEAVSKQSAMMKIDYCAMKEQSNAFWVLSKFKIEVESEMPTWREIVNVATWPRKPELVKCYRDYLLKDNDGKIIVRATSRWCVLDMETLRIRRISGTCFPSEFEFYEEVALEPDFEKVETELDESCYVFTKEILYSDLDMNKHTNNVVYDVLSVDALSLDEFDSRKIKTFDIEFINQSYYKDKIKIYRKKIDEDKVIVLGKKDGQEIFKTIITFGKL